MAQCGLRKGSQRGWRVSIGVEAARFGGDRRALGKPARRMTPRTARPKQDHGCREAAFRGGITSAPLGRLTDRVVSTAAETPGADGKRIERLPCAIRFSERPRWRQTPRAGSCIVLPCRSENRSNRTPKAGTAGTLTGEVAGSQLDRRKHYHFLRQGTSSKAR